MYDGVNRSAYCHISPPLRPDGTSGTFCDVYTLWCGYVFMNTLWRNMTSRAGESHVVKGERGYDVTL